MSGVTDCGVAEHPDLRVLPNRDDIGFAAVAGATPARTVNGVAWIDHCDITFQKGYEANPALWTHEIGHCLGLAHSDVAGAVMQSSPGGATPQPDDIAAIQSLYGPRTEPLAYRIIVPF